jgi:hypothetical protein
MKKSDLRKVLVKALEQLDSSEAPEEFLFHHHIDTGGYSDATQRVWNFDLNLSWHKEEGAVLLEYFGDQEPGVDPKQFWDKD